MKVNTGLFFRFEPLWMCLDQPVDNLCKSVHKSVHIFLVIFDKYCVWESVNTFFLSKSTGINLADHFTIHRGV